MPIIKQDLEQLKGNYIVISSTPNSTIISGTVNNIRFAKNGVIYIHKKK
jgi:tetrahydromethanopterin S-methyltransferase subunit F